VHRTMHILDVISSVSRSSRCTKIVGSWELQRFPDPVAGFKEPTSKGPTSKKRGG